MPFTQDREDKRFAMLASVIANSSGKSVKNFLSQNVFMPNYFDEPKPIIPVKTLEQQKKEAMAFHQKYVEAKKL